ncbi:serine/threonine-protein kinase SBK1-like [Gastrophryne carolinensis]
MADVIQEVTRNTAKSLLQLISWTSERLKMTEVAEHFIFIKELGTGSYGKVLLAKYRAAGQFVAVKLLSKKTTPMDNFLMEYTMSLSLSCHPHIILTHDIAFQTTSDYVFVQEVAPAGSLQSIIKPKIGLHEEMVKRCVTQIASALDFMHSRGMVHRDIKLDNILLMDLECRHIKLADFGLTRLQGTLAPSMSWFIPYTAPELCCLPKGGQILLHPSLDVWAFGVVVYIILTGLFPWKLADGQDQKYRDFAWWQVRKDVTLAPHMWQMFSTEARQMFWELLALDASERCPAVDILKYIDLPWKEKSPQEIVIKNTGVLHITYRPYEASGGASHVDHDTAMLAIGAEEEIT